MGIQEGIQINKFISSSGFCSRREADELVEQGRVTINGKLALPTSRVQEEDKVAIDGERVKYSSTDRLYIAFNKPKGVTSTTDPKDKSSIIRFISHNKRIFPIGRLDKDSEGLILLTDDGDIVNKILRAGNAHQKEYTVTVDKPLTPEFIRTMSEGVAILDTVTLPCIVKSLGSKKFKIILTQGLNRQIRRMCDALGYKVQDLVRERVMHIRLKDLPLGKWRKLTQLEIDEMMTYVKDSSKTAAPKKKMAFNQTVETGPDGKKWYGPKKAGFSKTGGYGYKPQAPKDKATIKEEKHKRSVETLSVMKKTSSRKNYKAKPVTGNKKSRHKK
ncbi:MAG: pseudouridine synthase [Bacteroidota bacterium]